MYNLNSHYENIFHFLSTIVTHRRVLYLHPYGSTQPENIEHISDNLDEINARLWAEGRVSSIEDGPQFIFYDQEPIYGEFNHRLFDHISTSTRGPFILVTTEKDSASLSLIQERYGWAVVYYFHHALAAHDWFRGYKYDSRLIAPQDRKLQKKYITFNRLTSSTRVYRSLFISELIQRDILDQGHVSYNDTCPDGGTYVENLQTAVANKLITQDTADEAIANIASAPLPLRIDYQDRDLIPNHSFVLSAVPETQESFVYVVTETCYWETKKHLTEKIFKPIVSKMPFILVGPAHNLAYLRSYGFKTFDRWIDESYDTIEDPIARMHAIGQVLLDISNRSLDDLQDMLNEMAPVLEYNHELFYSQFFVDSIWNELTTNLELAVAPK
jgi:hypothetical protein